MNKTVVRPFFVLLAIVATIVVNGLANALPINGMGTGEISDQFSILFVPAGYVFSIWGLIYIGLIGYALFQLLPSQRTNTNLRQIDGLVVIASLANITWIFLWHYQQFLWTLVAMLTLLVALIGIYLRLDIGQVRLSARERWLVQHPFSLYLGWISVATVANVTQVLYYINWNGLGLAPTTWMMVMLTIVVLLAVMVTKNRKDIAFLGVFIWAFVGIAIRHAEVPAASTGSWIAAVLTVILLIYSFVFRMSNRTKA